MPSSLARRGALALLLALPLLLLGPMAASADVPSPLPFRVPDKVYWINPCGRTYTPDVSHHIPAGRDMWDFGDAPEHVKDGHMAAYIRSDGVETEGHFPTRVDSYHGSTPGARHRFTNVGWLGSSVSREQDVVTGTDPDGVNNYHRGLPDWDRHDDGLLSRTLPAGGTGVLQFTVSTQPGLRGWYVNALVDWNLDGWWDTPPGGDDEWAIRNFRVDVPAGQSGVFSVPLVAGTQPGTPWVRLTLTDRPIPYDAADPAFYTGEWTGSMPRNAYDPGGDRAFTCGETEDTCGLLRVARPEATALPSDTLTKRCATPVKVGDPRGGTSHEQDEPGPADAEQADAPEPAGAEEPVDA